MATISWVDRFKKLLHFHSWTGWGVIKSVYKPYGRGYYTISKCCIKCGIEKTKIINMRGFKRGRTSR